MDQLQPQDESGAEPLSAGARYRAHLSRFPERPCEPPPPRWWRELLRAVRLFAWWTPRRRRYGQR